MAINRGLHGQHDKKCRAGIKKIMEEKNPERSDKVLEKPPKMTEEEIHRDTIVQESQAKKQKTENNRTRPQANERKRKKEEIDERQMEGNMKQDEKQEMKTEQKKGKEERMMIDADSLWARTQKKRNETRIQIDYMCTTPGLRGGAYAQTFQ